MFDHFGYPGRRRKEERDVGSDDVRSYVRSLAAGHTTYRLYILQNLY